MNIKELKQKCLLCDQINPNINIEDYFYCCKLNIENSSIYKYFICNEFYDIYFLNKNLYIRNDTIFIINNCFHVLDDNSIIVKNFTFSSKEDLYTKINKIYNLTTFK